MAIPRASARDPVRPGPASLSLRLPASVLPEYYRRGRRVRVTRGQPEAQRLAASEPSQHELSEACHRGSGGRTQSLSRHGPAFKLP